jgi:hypothetical protein
MIRLIRFYFLLPLCSVFFPQKANATHLRAGDITVAHPSCSSLEYVITLHVYTRVDPPIVTVVFGGGTLNFGDGTSLITQSRPNPPVIAQVDNGGVGDVEYPVTHTFPGPGTYTITYYEQNRNQGVLNINNSVETPFFIQTQITIDDGLGCDNTPVLLVPPIDEGCTGVTFTHNPGAYDPDGDSLSYALYVPEQGGIYNASGNFVSGVPVGGYQDPNTCGFYTAVGINCSQANERGNGPPTFSINALTGTITWDAPGEAGEYNIAFFVIEWRKRFGQWYQLGYVERDMQIIIQDCHNERPLLQLPKDTCVVAGARIKALIIATDPDGSPTSGAGGIGDSVNIQAYSNVFSLGNSSATYTPYSTYQKPIWQPTYSPNQQAQLQFSWQTDCSDVAQEPYQVVFKATDNGAPPLATFGTWNITVVAPPPLWSSATVNPGQRTSQLNWQLYSASCQNVSTGSLMQIWRRVDSNPFVSPNCVTGIPAGAGYTMIAQVPITSTVYLDKGLAPGAEYCYRLVASVQLTSGSYVPSIVSQEICVPPIIANAPVLTNVTVDVTDPQAGQITVKWRPPYQASASQFPPPFTYVVLRSENSSAQSSLKVANPGQLTDTTFADTNLNTQYPNLYFYRVLAYASNGSFVDSSAMASSVQLALKPVFKEVQLFWSASVPWSNNTFEYPRHLIYRGASGATKLSDLTLIDSVDVNSLTQFTYLDSGQYSNTPLVETQTYCYAVMTRGSYGNPQIKSPLNNFSEITCSAPDNKVPPCAPTLAVTGIDCSSYSACPLIGTVQTTYSNTVKWKKAPTSASCNPFIKGYNVYASPFIGQPFTIIAPLVTDTFYVQSNLPSYAMCYKVSSVDLAGNESPLSDSFCFDNCPNYVLPNVFTPNGDKCNEVFSAYSLRSLTSLSENGSGVTPCSQLDSTQVNVLRTNCARFVSGVAFTVYNRWGKEVYSYQSGGENTIYIDWNGKDNAGHDLDAGTYYYVANVVFDVVDPKKQNRTLKGWVVIMR